MQLRRLSTVCAPRLQIASQQRMAASICRLNSINSRRYLQTATSQPAAPAANPFLKDPTAVPPVVPSSTIPSSSLQTASPANPLLGLDTTTGRSTTTQGSFNAFDNKQPNTPSTTDREDDALRRNILDAALKHVNVHGWTVEAIQAGAAEAGYSSPVISGLFPRGAYELVEHLIVKQNRELSEKLRAMPLHIMRTGEKIRAALRLRLEMETPYMSTWPQAMALGALPQNAPDTLKHIAELMDEIWHIAGDRSTDMNWYTKRALLGSVYVATELYMTTDRSTGYANTWDFLDRRLSDVQTLGRLPSEVQSAISNLGSVAGQIFNMFNQPRRS